MNIPVIVFADTAGHYVSMIERQRGTVSVARAVHEFSELLGIAQTGIARAALIVGEHPELSQSLVDQLIDEDVAVVVVSDPGTEPGLAGVCWVSTLADSDELLNAVTESAQQPGQVPECLTPGAEQAKVATGDPAPLNATETSTAEPSDADDAGESSDPRDELPDHDREAQPSVTQGRIVTVWGASGAPGRSTIAINIAAMAAREGLRVCLIDADTHAPSVSALLGMVEDYSGLSQLCLMADRATLTTDKVRETVSTIAVEDHYLDVLTGITRASRWPEIRSTPFVSLLHLIRDMYDLVIIDVAHPIEEDEELSFDGIAPRRNAATLTALENSQTVIVVGSGDVLGIPRLMLAYEELQEKIQRWESAPEVNIWVNKLRHHAVGTNAIHGINRAWERFGPQRPIAGYIAYDQTTIDSAWLNGRTLAEQGTTTEVAQQLEKLLRSLHSGNAEPSDSERRPAVAVLTRRTSEVGEEDRRSPWDTWRSWLQRRRGNEENTGR